MNLTPFKLKSAAKLALKVYDHSLTAGHGVEYRVDHILPKETTSNCRVITFAGTNGLFWDWIHNLDLRSRHGLKSSSMTGAARVHRIISELPDCRHTIVTGHSYGGSLAIAYFLQYCNPARDLCAAFAPPPTVGLRNIDRMDGITVFRDPDDPVDIAGRFRFRHPAPGRGAKHIFAPDDPGWKDLDDHYMKNWVRFVGVNP